MATPCARRAPRRGDRRLPPRHRAAPGLGEAWWSLANLKTVRFAPAEAAAMQARSARAASADEDRLHLHYALGKALEDDGRFAEALRPLRRRARDPARAGCAYDAERRPRAAWRAPMALLHAGASSPSAPAAARRDRRRSSSSACRAPARPWSSRSSPATRQVEGTMELPDIAAIARELARRRRPAAPTIREALAAL